ncbi:MAG: hypothetical protein ABIZ57_11810 [Candidatus Limnocylindria bacterium]
MSYDLHVYSRRQPRAADLEAFLATEPILTADGRLKRDGYVLLSDTAGVHAEVDGPARTEAEDLPDAANGAIRVSGWLVQVSIKPSTDTQWPMAFATHLAQASEGVVYDPQEDRVAWPAGFQPRDPESGEERISEVELAWFTAIPRGDEAVPRRFLAAVEQAAPEALPRRYGDVEPLPHRFEGPTAKDEFVTRWQEVAATYMPMLFWTATRPCFGGTGWMSTTHHADAPKLGRPITKISLSLDGRALARDPQLTERMIGVFLDLGTSLSCVYAAGTVQRDLIVRRGRSSFDRRTESSPLPYASRWMGLPVAPTWLAWFGHPYADLVRPTVAPFIREERHGGLFVRLADEPANRDQLAGLFPALPLDLIARRKNQPAAWEPEARYSFADSPPSQVATTVPDFNPS